MEYILPKLRGHERLSLELRALFEQHGYKLYRTSSFEEYDLYMQNKPFLMGEDIITFTAADGRLMALKPDVTLSIVKNTPAGQNRKVYYHENVFRRKRQSGEYREINQMGIECIGEDGINAEAGVLNLALASLEIVGRSVLDLSHMELIGAILEPFEPSGQTQDAKAALRGKSPHAMFKAAQNAGINNETANRLSKLCEISAYFPDALPLVKELTKGLTGAEKALDELNNIYSMLKPSKTPVRLDLSIINDVDYYNGLIFQGFCEGSPKPVLSGGRYNNLMRRFNKTQGAIGFALYLDEVTPGKPTAETDTGAEPWLNIALPKGRLGEKVYSLMQEIGYTCGEIIGESRKLIFENPENRVRFFWVKPSDVDVYVEHGVADIGVVGLDVILESGADVLELLDLGFGRCKLAVAAKNGFEEDTARILRVATKYPSVARKYYATKNRAVEIIKLHGSMELAPLINLADVIVDIVETGATLKENNLSVIEDIAPVSAHLIANPASWRFKQKQIATLAERLGETL